MSKNYHEFDELVVGTGLNAVLYSFLEQKPLIINSTQKPLFFDFFPEGYDLSRLDIHLDEYTLRGRKKHKSWRFKIRCVGKTSLFFVALGPFAITQPSGPTTGRG